MKTVINTAHNSLTNIFNETKYEVNSVKAQWVKKPGNTSLLKGYS